MRAGHLRAGVQARRRPAAARCRRPAPTWRSWSTSTAAPPAWSPSRTSSRRSSARSPTSTTWSGPPVERLDDGAVRVTARLPVEDLGELFDVELPTDEVETVGGLLAQALGRVPIPGAAADVGGLHAGRRGHHRPAQPDRHGAGAAGSTAARRRSPDDRHPSREAARRCLSTRCRTDATPGRDAEDAKLVTLARARPGPGRRASRAPRSATGRPDVRRGHRGAAVAVAHRAAAGGGRRRSPAGASRLEAAAVVTEASDAGRGRRTPRCGTCPPARRSTWPRRTARSRGTVTDVTP